MLRKTGGNSEILLLILLAATIRPLNIHQNDIHADFGNAVYGDQKVRLPPEQAEKAAGSRHDKRLDLTALPIKVRIADKAQPVTVADVDDLLASKFR